jgi:BirA family transcriptional regulator, biotin operon repressor / biotin---[acetyl-CoA-carboxylase] ligase
MTRSPLRAAPATVRRAARNAVTPPNLLALLAGGSEVSGAEIATALGITRAAVWKQIEQLRARGLAVHAEAGRGYRLAGPIELLDGARIAAAITPDERARIGAIDVRWQVDSTSSELARTADSQPLPRACLAEIQTAGRGRRGRRWQTPLAGGIALSFARRFDGGMASLSGLSLVAGIAVLRALADANIDGAALKWPNDIVANGRKLGGILVELGGDALGPCRAIVGIGLNVRIGAAEGAAIDQPWTDLATLAAETPSRNVIAARVLAQLAAALDAFAIDGFATFEQEYARHDALLGREVVIASGSERWTGIADGVTSRGALRVMRDGRAVEVDSGEVSVRARAE